VENRQRRRPARFDRDVHPTVGIEIARDEHVRNEVEDLENGLPERPVPELARTSTRRVVLRKTHDDPTATRPLVGGNEVGIAVAVEVRDCGCDGDRGAIATPCAIDRVGKETDKRGGKEKENGGQPYETGRWRHDAPPSWMLDSYAGCVGGSMTD
jgi:hypothetical protein